MFYLYIRSMKKLGTCIICILVYFLGFSQVIILDSLAENGGYSYKSQPIGAGPLPGVLYSHGGLGNAVGGNLRGTCIALAQNGYMGWCNKRTTDIPLNSIPYENLFSTITSMSYLGYLYLFYYLFLRLF